MLKIFTSYRLLLRAFLTLGFLGSIGLSDVASMVGIGAGLNSLFGGGGSNSQNYGAGSGVSATTGAMSTTQPGDLAAYYQLLGISPSGYVGAGQQAGQQYTDQAQLMQMYQQMMQQQAGISGGAQKNLMGAGNQLWNTAQDPQHQLYNYMLQQTQDQSRAGTSARGIGMSPEAAGLEQQATTNFNMDWQNQQLARQAQGLSGMTQAYGGAGQQGALAGVNLGQAAGYGQQGAQNTLQSGQVPWQAQQTAYGAPLNAANMYSSALNTAFNPNLASYNQAQSQFGANQQQMGMYGLTQGLNSLNNSPWIQQMFSGGGGGSGGGSGTANYGAGGWYPGMVGDTSLGSL